MACDNCATQTEDGWYSLVPVDGDIERLCPDCYKQWRGEAAMTEEKPEGEKIMLDVSETDLGVWVPFTGNLFEFNIEIVELARKHKFEVSEKIWEADKPMFLNNHATFEMVEDLGFLVDTALDYLNSIVPVGYYFDFEDGLSLFRDEDNEHTL